LRPLLSLPDACTPLNLAARARDALSRAATVMHKQPLSADDKASIYLYTTNALYSGLNATLRSQDRAKVQKYLSYLRVFLNAFDRLSSGAGAPPPLFRGIGKNLAAEYGKGETVTWWSVSSCTPNIAVARGFGGGSKNGTLFRVESHSAVSIAALSAFKGEEEWILAPGTQLEVVDVNKSGAGPCEITLRELKNERMVR